MITAHNDNGIFEFPCLFQFFNQHTESGVKCLNLAKVVCNVFTHHGNIRHKSRYSSLELIRIDPPEVFAGTADPFAVAVRWAPPVTQWLTILSVCEIVLKIASYFSKQSLLCAFDVIPIASKELTEPVMFPASPVVLSSRSTEWRITIVPGAPNLVGVPNMVTHVLQQKRVSRDLEIPVCPLQNCALACPPKVLARQQRTATWGTGRSVNKRIGKQDSLLCDSIKVRSLNQVRGPAFFDRRISSRVSPPVICKCEDHIGAIRRSDTGNHQQQAENRKGPSHSGSIL